MTSFLQFFTILYSKVQIVTAKSQVSEPFHSLDAQKQRNQTKPRKSEYPSRADERIIS